MIDGSTRELTGNKYIWIYKNYHVTLCESKYWVPDSAAQVRPKVIQTNIGI